jgi:hypothetical protein
MKNHCKTEKRLSNIRNISLLQPHVVFNWKIAIYILPYLKTEFPLMKLQNGIGVGSSPNVEIKIPTSNPLTKDFSPEINGKVVRRN